MFPNKIAETLCLYFTRAAYDVIAIGVGRRCRRSLAFGALALFTINDPTFASPAPGNGLSFLGTVALPVQRTPLDDKWLSAMGGEATASLSARRFVGSTKGLDPVHRLLAINAWVNGNTHYRADVDAAGHPRDDWAPASSTLRRKAGDCEDIAILKFRLLEAAGESPDHLFLSIVKDRATLADHAILVVTLDGRSFVLDNRTNILLDATSDCDFAPIFSFNRRGKWTHGYQLHGGQNSHSPRYEICGSQRWLASSR